jgi:ubiquinone/menaquinone biosynthesis C-methylase UbiE
LGLGRWRAQLVEAATGTVLEVGAGTGRNLPHYRRARRIVLTDPDAAMLARTQRRLSGCCCPVEVVVADAQRLPFADRSFDEVVATLVFCTIPVPQAAYAEVRRVLRPGGVFRLLEHVRTPRSWIARMQDLLTPVWKRLAHGCHLNRCSLETARAQGFKPRAVRTGLDGWLVAAELVPGDAG